MQRLAKNNLTVLSLFAGCGGSSLGYVQAGYTVKLAVEWDQDAADTYRLNFASTPLLQVDIRTLSGDMILETANIQSGALDILDGSPPCQGFSLNGNRQVTDSRNQLFQDYVRLLIELQPRAFVMENVPGLIMGKMKLLFADIMTAFSQLNYHVSCRLLKAWWYGVPQSRERLIWIGIRKDLNIMSSHPLPIYKKPLTVQEALTGLEVPSWNRSFENTKVKQEIAALQPGTNSPKHFNHHRLSFTKMAPTLTRDFAGYLHYWHPDGTRPLRYMEWARLQGFPDSFQWIGEDKKIMPLIGNSVPPPMTKAIGLHLRDIMGWEKYTGQKAVKA